MLEKVYRFAVSDEKNIEKVVDDEHTAINHMVLPKGERLPEHYSNSNVYMIIVRGTMSLKLDEQEPNQYAMGQIISIPYHTKMDARNLADETLDFLVVKSPNPRNYKDS